MLHLLLFAGCFVETHIISPGYKIPQNNYKRLLCCDSPDMRMKAAEEQYKAMVRGIIVLIKLMQRWRHTAENVNV